jgi:hypothetical protein
MLAINAIFSPVFLNVFIPVCAQSLTLAKSVLYLITRLAPASTYKPRKRTSKLYRYNILEARSLKLNTHDIRPGGDEKTFAENANALWSGTKT